MECLQYRPKLTWLKPRSVSLAKNLRHFANTPRIRKHKTHGIGIFDTQRGDKIPQEAFFLPLFLYLTSTLLSNRSENLLKRL